MTIPRLAALLVALSTMVPATAAEWPLRDKTLVVWAAPANLEQRGGAVLSIQRPGGPFDAAVFGELAPARWMAGSEFFHRTRLDQSAWPAETADADTFARIAIVYKDKHVTMHRDAELLAEYDMDAEPAAFDESSFVLIGLRHVELASGGPTFRGRIEDARIYPVALDAETLATLKPDQPSDPMPLAWWTFADGKVEDAMGTFPKARLVGDAAVKDGRLHLNGGHVLAGEGFGPLRTRETEDWPSYHVTALPSEGLARPYDPNGCIWWGGKYHLMYIYQDPNLPHGGHCWGHAVSEDLVDWTFLPPALVPGPDDKDVGAFSGNAFINRDGVPMLCWFGVDAGVCVATAEPGDDDLIRWRRHPNNPIIPIPGEGEPGHGVYTVWDPYLWLEGDDYVCLLGGNKLPNGKDTLYAMKSRDLASWEPIGPFFEHPDLSWTTEGEDCSCPDFFKLGDKRALLCISHKVGGRMYIGRYENERFFPERHVRMNWPGGQFFAPESLLDGKGRRIVWAWITDPRVLPTQQATGSGVQSLPRVLDLDADGGLTVRPVPELERLRRNARTIADLAFEAEAILPDVRGDRMELAMEIDPGTAEEVVVSVRRSPDGSESTAIILRPRAGTLAIDCSKSTLRDDVVYAEGPLDTGGIIRAADYKHPRNRFEAPLELKPGESARLRIFLDGPMLEVFANDRQCLTQQVFPESREALGVSLAARGGRAVASSIRAWDMAPAKFIDRKGGR